MTGIYAKIDDVQNLTAAELVDEIYNEDPEVVFDVLRKNRRLPATQTNTEAFAAFVMQRKLEADDVVDGYLLAEEENRAAERGTTLRALATSLVEAARDLQPAHERAEALKHFVDLLATFDRP